MSEKTLENYGKSFLVLILPISFLIVVVVNTWRFLLIGLALLIGLNLWQQYRWEVWCEKVNPLFYQLIRENQGKITPIDLSIKGNFSGNQAKRYLETKAKEFGANVLNSDQESPSYYFITASILGDILDSSDPVEKPVHSVTKEARSLLAAPPTTTLQEEEKEKPQETTTESISEIQEQIQETTTESVSEVQEQPPEEPLVVTEDPPEKTLEKQLVFGSLIQSELAKRLGVYSSTVYKRRNDPNFPEWSRQRDPDGIAWSFSRKSREFFPVEE